MTIRSFAVAACAAALAAALALPGPAHAAFPDKPVTLVVPYVPGGAADIFGRIIARGLGQKLGQPVVVENKAGAGTAIGAAAVQNAAPDGYTLLISSTSTFTVLPSVRANLPFDPQKFDSIGIAGSVPLVLLAHPSVPAASVKDVVALAKAKPGGLSYASFGAGTSSHFGGEMFKQATGIDLLHVPYKGSAPAMQDLIGGQVQFSVDTVAPVKPQVDAGRVKAIAVMAPRRIGMLPNVPTVAESGYPGFAVEPWIAVVTPRGVPEATHKVLAKAFADAIADPAIRADLAKSGMDVAYEPPGAYAQRLAKELPQMRALVHKAKIAAE